jgi:hypothetical protein
MALLVAWVVLIVFLWSVDLVLHDNPGSRRWALFGLGSFGNRSGADAVMTANRVVWVMLGLLWVVQLWVGLQWVMGWTLHPFQTFRALLLGVTYSLFFFIILVLFYSRPRLLWLVLWCFGALVLWCFGALVLWCFGALVLSGTLQAFIGISRVIGEFVWLSEWLGLPVSGGTASGTFVNRNHFAGYLEMTLALGIGLMLALRTGERWSWRNLLALILSQKLVIRLALIVMVIGLVMSQSRMGNMAFMVSLLVVGAVFVLTIPTHRLRNGFILLSILLIDVFIISQYFGLERLKDRIVSTEVSVSVERGQLVFNVDDLRAIAWDQAQPLAQANALIGEGAGAYEVAFMPYAGLRFGSHFDHAHHDYLQFFIELGFIGFVPLLLFVLMAIGLAVKAMMFHQSLFRSGLGFGVAMALVAIAIHSFSDFNLQIPANALTFVTVCALAVLTVFHSRDSKRIAE